MLWDLPTNEKRVLQIKKGPATSIAYSPDQRLIAVGVQKSTGYLNQKLFLTGECQLWDPISGKLVHVIKSLDETVGPSGKGTTAITAVTFAPDGRTLILGDVHGRLLLCDVDRKQELRPLGKHPVRVTSLVISPDQQLLASIGGAEVRVWGLADWKERCVIRGQFASGVAFLDRGSTLVTVGADRKVKFWDVASGRLRKEMPDTQPDAVLGIASNGQTLALACRDRSVKLWDLTSGQLRAVLSGHDHEVTAVAFSADGKLLISAGSVPASREWWVHGGEIKLWEAVGYSRPQSEESRRYREAARAFRMHLSKADAKETLLTNLRQDQTLGETIRRQALEFAERIPADVDDEGFLRTWLLLLPIPMPKGQTCEEAVHLQQVPDEAKLHPRPGENLTVGMQQLTWKRGWARDYFIDFNAVVGKETPNSVAYAVCYLDCEKEHRDLTMKIGSDDQARIYLNGKEVFKHLVGRAIGKDQNEVRNLTLPRGRNVVVFKVVNGTKEWAGCLRFLDKSGKVFTDFKVRLTQE